MDPLQLLYAIFILPCLYLCYAGEINCNSFKDANCFGKSINCVQDGQDCTVICGYQACQFSTVNCAPGVACSVQCLGYRSCQNMVINGGSAVSLTVSTTNIAQQSLGDAQIDCQNVSYCDVTCTEKHYQCRNSQINAENAGQLVVKCEGNNQYTFHCQGLDIYCPNSQRKCWISSPNVLAEVEIYSQFGFDGVALCGDYLDTNVESIGNIHCGSEYHETCAIHPFSVNYCESQSICDATNSFIDCSIPPPTTIIPTNFPTSNPSLLPTLIPTSNPSIIPTNVPTLVPSNSPTESPIKNSILSASPTFADIKLVTKTVMVFVENKEQTPTLFNAAGFMTILVLVVLVCCVMMCVVVTIQYKKQSKSNVAYECHVRNDTYDNDINICELRQLKQNSIVNHNDNGLIFYTKNRTKTVSMEGNNTVKCNEACEVYEGENGSQNKTEMYSQSCQIGAVQINDSLSSLDTITSLADEDITGALSDDDIYGPGHANKTRNGKYTK